MTLFGGLGALFWSYASVGFDVILIPEIIVDKELYFYIALFILCATNFLLYGLSTQDHSTRNVYLQGWEYSFGIILNSFFIVSVLFIAIYNNTEPYEFNYFGSLIVVFLALMVIWLLALPFLIIFLRKS